ncbi:hypothetical protein QWJ06_00500 [Kocuria rhizophila]|uniref:DUF4439 domain-containing protein n=1 Tax=Kocuria rhizophila TaxID=72000 RepID=A0AAX2SBS4_KOCRH|nr:hypothetical protein [Kocuria rhizophila]MXN61110.1 hypothetical protein [Bacillus sp. BGMRC0062]KIC65776.1 hypothetical protein RK09_11375 [Kocuria rhizophila]MBO4145495.1 hypothetical protein [Kocuria rhizophila]MCR4525878.1 hypothetical protein [Kocuria rhizophila]MCT1915736.1 hypothetical protein [Kocuria rhizophila]
MQQRMRVLCATTVLAVLSAALTGCSASQAPSGAAPETAPAVPGPTATGARPTASRAATPAKTQECFDVAEAVSGVELLPLSHDSEHESQDAGTLDQARASAHKMFAQLPSAVQPAFDQVERILDGAGEALEPSEAAKIQQALAPADAWLQSHCSASPGSMSSSAVAPTG